VLDALPAPVEGALVQAMAIRMEDRPATPAAFMAALRATTAYPARRRDRDTEVDRILSHAAELENAAPTDAGLTLGGVQDAAAQAGIPERHVRQAAQALDAPADAEPVNWFLGSPTTIRIRRVVEGEVPESEYEAVAEEIRLTLGVEGHLKALGRSMTWRARAPKDNRDWTMESWVNEMLRDSMTEEAPDTRVRIVRRGGRTHIDIEQHTGELAGGWFGGIIGGVGGGGSAGAVVLAATAVISPVLAVAAGVVALAGSYGMSRAFYRASLRKRTRKLTDLADRLAEYVRDAVTGGIDER
jgi:hypothetical protein